MYDETDWQLITHDFAFRGHMIFAFGAASPAEHDKSAPEQVMTQFGNSLH